MREYLTEDAKRQETRCKSHGNWLVEGLTILRIRTWGYPDRWVIFDGDRHYGPSQNIDFPSLTAARNWLADHLSPSF
jgi:hypothetical protein